MKRRSLLLTAAIPVMLAGAVVLPALAADTVAEQINNASRVRERILNDLYVAYGGGETSGNLKKENAQKPSSGESFPGNVGRDVTEGVGKVVTDVDRATFDAQCRRVGEGQKPVLASDRLNAFLSKPDVVSSCDEVARLDLEINQLKRNQP